MRSFPVVEGYRQELRNQSFERVDDIGMVELRRNSVDAHQSSVIEGIHPTPEVEALFTMLLEEHVPPEVSEFYVMRYVTEQLVPAARAVDIKEAV